MKKRSSLLALFSFAILMVTQVHAYAKEVSDEAVYSYLNLSGAQSALAGIPAQLAGMGQQMQLTAKDPAESQKVLNAITSSWQQDDIDKIVFDHIKQNVSAEEMAKLIEWLGSDQISRIKIAEEQASAPNFEQMFMAYMSTMNETPPSQTRITAARDFIETTNAVDNTVGMVMDMSKGLLDNIQSISGQEMPKEAIEAQMAQMKAMLTAQMEQQLIMVSYYLYQDISDEDFAEYTQFYKGALGQKDIALIYGSIGDAMTHWAAVMAEKFAQEFAEKKAAS